MVYYWYSSIKRLCTKNYKKGFFIIWKKKKYKNLEKLASVRRVP